MDGRGPDRVDADGAGALVDDRVVAPSSTVVVLARVIFVCVSLCILCICVSNINITYEKKFNLSPAGTTSSSTGGLGPATSAGSRGRTHRRHRTNVRFVISLEYPRPSLLQSNR